MVENASPDVFFSQIVHNKRAPEAEAASPRQLAVACPAANEARKLAQLDPVGDLRQVDPIG